MRVKNQEPGAKTNKAKGNVKLEQKELPTENSKLQTDPMEVHHHPQLEHKPKPWKEYLLEGLMIFLAVTMGFFAESLREHIADKEKETQYIQSLAEDLKGDIKMFDLQIKEEKERATMLDSLVIILNNPNDMVIHAADIYYFGRLGPRLKNLIINNRTFEQLKNSGNFRLISGIGVSNRIMSYYEKVTYVRQIEDIYNQEFAGYKNAASNVFEPTVLRNQETDNSGIRKLTDNPQLQKDAGHFTKQLAFYAVYMNGSRRGILGVDRELLEGAKELLDYLQKQYDLEDK